MYHVRVIQEGVVIEHRLFHEPLDSAKEREIINNRNCWIDIERIPTDCREHIVEEPDG